MAFELTYATMFNPPEELHTKFEETFAHFQETLGKEYPMLIGGEERFAKEKFEVYSPVKILRRYKEFSGKTIAEYFNNSRSS